MAKTIRILKRKLYEAEDELQNNSSNSESTESNTEESDTNTQEASGNKQEKTDDKFKFKIEYVGSNNPKVEQGIKDQVTNDFASNIIRDTTLFKVKMSFSFQKDISFPSATTQLNALMSATSMPKKFQNIYGSYDNNPLKTIYEAEDLAEKYFEALKPEKKEAQPEVKDESNNGKPAQQENASIHYHYEKYLNEGLFSGAFNFGNLLGTMFNYGAGAAASATAGFVKGAAPTLAAAHVAGQALGATGPDHGQWLHDDRELHKQYDETKTNAKSSQNEVTQAIGSYINNLLIVLEQGLQHITSGNSTKDITEFSDIVIDALNNRSKEMTDQFLEDNNKRLKEAKKNKLDKLDRKIRQEEKVKNRVAMRIQNGDIDVTPADYLAFMADNQVSKEAAQKIKKAISQESKNIGLDESAIYNYAHSLNEELGDDSDIIFDADAMYSEFQRLFRQKMNQILSAKPEDWDVVKTAKKQMEVLRDGATKEIETSIQHVCRLASSDQLGVSSKIQGFLSKHPLRAAKLTNLWKRHETDLNFRIEQRIKQISELDGKGPLRMAKEFYKNTLPNLLAMMIVYKTLYTMYNNEKLCNPAIALGNQKTVKSVEERVNTMKNAYPDAIAKEFGINSAKLSQDGTAVYNYQSNSFEKEHIDYLFLLINNLIKPEQYNQKTLQVAEQLDNELQGYVAGKQINEFFSRLSDFILLDCGVNSYKEAIQLLHDAFDNLNGADIQALANIDPGTVAAVPDNPVTPVILAYIAKTNGDFLYRYTQTPDIKVEANEESILKAKESWNIKDVTVDNVNEFIGYVNKASGALRSIQPEQINENLLHYIQAYVDMQLYKLSDIKMNPFVIMSTFISMCSNESLQTIFNNTAVIETYEAIRDKWQEKGSSNETWDAYIKEIAYNDKEYNELSVKGLAINNDDAFSMFVRNLKTNVENAQPDDFDNFFKDEKTKDIPTPGGLTSWESIANQIVTNEKYTSLTALMSIGINTDNDYKNLVFGTNAIKLLKQLLAYSLKVENALYVGNRNDLPILNKLWNNGKIMSGDGTNTFKNVIDILQNNYNMVKNNPKELKSVQLIIKHANAEFRAQCLSEDLAKNANQQLFDLLIDTDTKFQTADDFVEILKKNLYYNGKPIGEDSGHALNDYIVAICNYIENYKDYKALQKLLAFATYKAPENPQEDIDNAMNDNELTPVTDNYHFYFGIREFQFLTEADNDNKDSANKGDLESYLNSTEGQAWLSALAGESPNKQLTDNENQEENTEEADIISIDPNTINDAQLLAQSANKANTKLNNSTH